MPFTILMLVRHHAIGLAEVVLQAEVTCPAGQRLVDDCLHRQPQNWKLSSPHYLGSSGPKAFKGEAFKGF